MPGITPFLWFDQNAEEAVNFYVSIFKKSGSRFLQVAARHRQSSDCEIEPLDAVPDQHNRRGSAHFSCRCSVVCN